MGFMVVAVMVSDEVWSWRRRANWAGIDDGVLLRWRREVDGGAATERDIVQRRAGHGVDAGDGMLTASG